METTREIPRQEWGTFFEEFSRDHRDQPVRVEISGQDLGEQRLSEGLALMGMGLETKGSAQGDIDIALRLKAPDGAMNHRIAKPQRIYLEADSDANRYCLDIEDAENHKTLVYVEGGPTIH